MKGCWQRNLSVQVRLAGGTLVLKLAETTTSMTGAERAAWYRLDPERPVSELIATVPETEPALRALADLGMVVPAGGEVLG